MRTAQTLGALAVLGFVIPGCTDGHGPLTHNPSVELRQGALTAEQCTFFAEDDKVTICKATRSPRNPFVIIRVSTEGCINGIAGQDDGSYIAIDDPTCEGLGCFPERAPHDGTVACCDGLAPADDGTCADVDACLDNPCDTHATCEDLPAPAPNTGTGRSCTCDSGYSGTGEPGDCALPPPSGPVYSVGNTLGVRGSGMGGWSFIELLFHRADNPNDRFFLDLLPNGNPNWGFAYEITWSDTLVTLTSSVLSTYFHGVYLERLRSNVTTIYFEPPLHLP